MHHPALFVSALKRLFLLSLGTAILVSNGVYVLGQDDADVEENIGSFIEALKDEDRRTRDAIDALVQIGPAAVPGLVETLKDEDSRVAKLAALALFQIGPAAIPALKEALKDEDSHVAELAAYTLGRIGPIAVPALREVLNDEGGSFRFRAAWALGRIGPGAEAAVYDLVTALRIEDDDLRNAAADALGGIGAAAITSVPALIDALGDENEKVREAAAEALAKISESIANMSDLSVVELREITPNLTAAANALKSAGMDAKRVEAAIAALTAKLPTKPVSPAQDQVANDPQAAIDYCNEKKWPWAVAVYGVLSLFWTMVLRVWPYGIHATNELLRRLPEAKIKKPVEMTFSLRHLILVGFFQYHSRVLDAWVEGRLATARHNFNETPTVKDRATHVSLPVRLDGETVAVLRGKMFQPAFRQRQVRLLIRGEGGSGKTSLACQVARWAMGTEEAARIASHAMLPVLIEDEPGRRGWIEEARDKLQELVGESSTISPQFFRQLLKKKRVLMIVDHFSEMSDGARRQIRTDQAGFSPAALAFTSRIEEEQLGITTTLQTVPIKEDQVASFVRAYLTERKRASLFPDDEEYFEFCRHLSRLGGDRQITVLVAKTYADELARVKEDASLVTMPESIPDLMLRHVRGLHPEGADLAVVQVARQDAIEIAWQCTREKFYPGAVDRHAVIQNLAGEDGDSRVRYLEEKLRILRRSASSHDQITFTLGPLGECLAGLHVLERCKDNLKQWRSFLDEAEEKPVERIKGFLLAVRDCCLASEIKIPDLITDELARLGGLDLELVKQNRHRQRIRRLVDELKLPDAEGRCRAAEALGEIGPDADGAVSALISSLKDPELEVRESVASALGKIGEAAEAAVPRLSERLRDEQEAVRAAAACALGRIGPVAAVAIPDLIEMLKDEKESVVSSAIGALGRIGPVAESAVPALVEAMKDEQLEIREAAAEALGRIGSSAAETTPALLDTLKDDVESVRRAAVEALQKMGASAASVLIELLRNEGETGHKHDVAMALMGIGPSAAPALAEALGDESDDVRLYASLALKEIGGDAEAALPALIEALKDELDRVRLNAAWALQGLGRAAKAAVPALIETLTDANGGVRHNAVLALGRVGPEAEAAVPALAQALEDTNDGVRHNAVVALGEIDPEAKASLPALIEALRDEDEDVRRAAAEVLGKSEAAGVSEDLASGGCKPADGTGV